MIAPQIASALRYLVVLIGGILVSKGVLSQEQLAYVSDSAMLTTIIGALMAIGSAGYGIWKRRPAGIVADAAKLPEVRRVVTDIEMAEAVPSTKVQAN